MSAIKELFGHLTNQEIIDLFQGDTKGTDFQEYDGTFNLETYSPWFIIKHKPTGKLYGIEEISFDSWNNGAISYEVDYFEIHELEERQVKVTQHYSVGSESFNGGW